MCGRYTESAAFDVLAERFGLEVEESADEALFGRYNIAPSQPVPIIVADNGRRRLLAARWGLRPHWACDGKLAPINARAETVATSPMFREALKHHRCLMPADGFYEWQVRPGQKRKQPYYIRLKGGELFAFAGLYTPTGPEGEVPATCTIVTTAPNDLLAPIHNRMPVILESREEGRWLDPRVAKAADVLPCLRPLPAERMEAYAVSPLVSSPRSNGPELIAPVTGS